MKYIKYFESDKTFFSQVEKDIDYLAKQLSYPSIEYVKEVIQYYKLSEEQIHNLRLAVQYQYLYYEDYRNVVNDIINSKREYPDRVWYANESEIRLKDAYEKNFKTKIIDIPKPYPIARHKNYKLEDINSLESFNLYDVIGKIPGYTFIRKYETKYLVGEGRYYYNPEKNKESTIIYQTDSLEDAKENISIVASKIKFNV